MKQNLVACIEAIQTAQGDLSADMAFIELRSLSPSDDFVTAIVDIICEKSSVSAIANVLFHKDLAKNETDAAVWRVSDLSITQACLERLLGLMAQGPDTILPQSIGILAWGLQRHGHSMDAVIQFVQAACGSEEISIKRLGFAVLCELCDASLSSLLQVNGLNALDLLQHGLQIEDEEIAMSVVKALCNVLNNNTDADMQPIIPIDTCQTIYMAMVHRASAAIAAGWKRGSKMLAFIMRVIELQVDNYTPVIPAVMQLCGAVLQAGDAIDESTRKIALLLVQAMLYSRDKKNLIEQFLGFTQEIIFPLMVPSDAEICAQLASEGDLEGVDSNTVTEVAIETASSIANQLGKAVFYPIIQQRMQKAMDSPREALISVISAQATAAGLADSLKVAESQRLMRFALEILKTPAFQHETYLLLMAAKAAGAIAGDLKQRLVKIQKEIVQTISAFAVEKASGRLLATCTAAVTNVNAEATYETTIRVLPSVLGLIQKGLNNTLTAQIEAIHLFTSVCEVCTAEDIGQFLGETFPPVFQLFQNLMTASQQGVAFTYHQEQLVLAAVRLMSTVCGSMPESLAPHVDGILAAMAQVVQRAATNLEHEALQTTVEALSIIGASFPQNTAVVLPQICNLLISILADSVTEANQHALKEKELELKTHLVDQQIVVLQMFTNLIRERPESVAVCFDELFQTVVVAFEPVNDTQRHAWLQLLAELFHSATVLHAQNYLSYHQQVFQLFASQMSPTGLNGERRMTLVNMSECRDAADNLFFYIKYYLKAHLATPDPDYAQTQQRLLEIIEYITDKAKLLLKSFVDYSADNTTIPQEELEASICELFNEYDETLDQIKYCWGQFIYLFQENTSPALLGVIQSVAQQFISGSLETTPGKAEITQGLDLMSQAAQNLSPEQAQAFWAPMYESAMTKLMGADEFFQIYEKGFFAITQFYIKTQFLDPTRKDALMGLAARVLDTAHEDGSEAALRAYDNACTFLLHAGKATGQGTAFWQEILTRVQLMGEDEFEAARAAKFVMENWDALKQLGVGAFGVKAVISTILGKNYTYYLKADEEQLLDKVRAFLNQQNDLAQQAASELAGDEILARNLKLFSGQQ